MGSQLVTIALIAWLEAIVFAEHGIFGVLPPFSLAALVLLARGRSTSELLLLGGTAGLVLDSFRPAYAPAFTIGFFLAALGLRWWYTQQRVRSRRFSTHVLLPAIVLQALMLFLMMLPLQTGIGLFGMLRESALVAAMMGLVVWPLWLVMRQRELVK